MFNSFTLKTGLWGEIRQWNDGTTIVQKTHDASKHHVIEVRHRSISQKRPFKLNLLNRNYCLMKSYVSGFFWTWNRDYP